VFAGPSPMSSRVPLCWWGCAQSTHWLCGAPFRCGVGLILLGSNPSLFTNVESSRRNHWVSLTVPRSLSSCRGPMI